MAKPKVVLWRPMYNPIGHKLLEGGGADVVVVDSPNSDELKQVLHGAKALWVRTPERVTPDILDAGKDLVVVSTSGFGTDNIDIPAATERGICSFGFIDTDRKAEAVENLMQSWPESRFRENSAGPCPLVADIFTTAPNETRRPFNLLLKGTNFQVNVWKALRRIPEGRVVSYQDIAGLIGRPQSFRAVANAVAINPVAYLIPCHRVITKNGKIHPYRWGSARKKAILGWEAARRA